MLSTDRMSLNYRLFPDRLRRLFGPTVQEQKDLDHWHYDMMGQTMLIRNSDGDYTPAHRSLLEFFVAYKFAAEMGSLSPDFTELAQAQAHLDKGAASRDYTWSGYFQREIDETGQIVLIPPLGKFACEPMENLVNTIGKQKLAEAVLCLMTNMVVSESLWAIIEATRDRSLEECGYAAGNAISLLSRLKKDLRGVDFSSAKVKGADLEDVDLSSAIFRDADLTGARFSNAYLKNTDFTGAKLEEISFENPFIVGVPIRARTRLIAEPWSALLQEIARSISRCEHIAIVGLRRMGVSSLFRNLADCAPPDSEVLYIDLQSWIDETLLSDNILQRLKEYGLLEDVCDYVPVQPKSVRALADFLVKELRSSGKRLVLAIDETAVLLGQEPSRWRTAFDLFQILSDSGVLLTITHFARVDHIKRLQEIHPFFERHRVQFLGAFDDISAREWLVEMGHRTGIEYTPEALAFMSELTGNWPYLMQLSCSTLFEMFRVSGPNVIPIVLGRGKIETAVSHVLELGEAFFAYLALSMPDEWRSILGVLLRRGLTLEEIERSTALSGDRLRLGILPELVGNSMLKEKDGVYSIKADLVRTSLVHHWREGKLPR